MIYENIFNIIAQATSPAGGASNTGGSGSAPIIMMVCIGVIFYFMLIRPQSQKQKQQLSMIAALKTGDKVIVAGGIHGLVANVKDTTVLVKVADNVKLEVDKTSVISVTKRSEVETTPTPAA